MGYENDSLQMALSLSVRFWGTRVPCPCHLDSMWVGMAFWGVAFTSVCVGGRLYLMPFRTAQNSIYTKHYPQPSV